MSGATSRGDVKKVDVSGLSGAQMAAKITHVAADTKGTFEYVSDVADGPGSVFGWLMELGSAGDFIHAAEVFGRGAAIIDRLAHSGQTNVAGTAAPP